jgi:hypothetical protein
MNPNLCGSAECIAAWFAGKRHLFAMLQDHVTRLENTVCWRWSAGAWCDLPEQLRPFAGQAVFHRQESWRCARPRQARYVATADRIGGLCKHDRQVAGHLLQRTEGYQVSGQDDVRCKRDQLRRVSAKASASAKPER